MEKQSDLFGCIGLVLALAAAPIWRPRRRWWMSSDASRAQRAAGGFEER